MSVPYKRQRRSLRFLSLNSPSEMPASVTLLSLLQQVIRKMQLLQMAPTAI